MNGWGNNPVQGGETRPLHPFLCVAERFFSDSAFCGPCPLETRGQLKPTPQGCCPLSCPSGPGRGLPRWPSSRSVSSLALWPLLGDAPLITTSLVIDLSALRTWWGWAFKVKTAICCKAELFYAIPVLVTQGRPGALSSRGKMLPRYFLASWTCRQSHRPLPFTPFPNKLPGLPWQKSVLAPGSCESNKGTKRVLGHRLIKSPLKQ